MKKIVMFAAGALLSVSLVAQDLPQPSPVGGVTQKVGLTNVEIEYSRPGVKNRTIFGDLLPYGTMWRTGANNATVVSFSTDVKINGKELLAGDYSLFTIPGKDSWQVMFNTNVNQAGTGGYQDSEEALRITVKPQAAPLTETLTLSVDNVTNASADICITWEKTKVCMDLTVDVSEQAVANIKNKIDEIENAHGVYNSAAKWYVENDLDPAQALAWAKKSTEIKEFPWSLYTLALAEEANGNYKGAIAAAERSRAAAQKMNYDAYVKMNDAKIAEWKKKK